MINSRYLAFLIAAAMAVGSCKKSEDSAVISKYVSRVLEYRPAPGQFINEKNTGTPEAAETLVGGTSSLLSLGAFGGYVVVAFDHTIQNGEGADIGIYGNPNTGVGTEWSEPGIVSVMQDKNGNGLADDGEWYELAGSEHLNPATVKNYRITYYNPRNSTDDVLWEDNQGKRGKVLRNIFHSQEYYPLWFKEQDSISFSGTLLPPAPRSEGLNTNPSFAWGYADSGSEEFIQLRYEYGRGYNTFDISWAVDKSGNKVDLQHIDFVRVMTAQNSAGSTGDDTTEGRQVGEVSTDVSGIIDLQIP
ncbi:PKD domain-containing protein [Arcticibacter pallidicorallinus]|nr:PKD domain-containing protein [Arcticibacter pallidicorallinus]